MADLSPYRRPTAPTAHAESIEYVCTDRDGGAPGLFVMVRTFLVPFIGSALVARYVNVTLGILLAVIAPLVQLSTWRKAFQQRVTLSVCDYRLRVRSAPGSLALDVSLDDLLDVELDSREVEIVRDGAGTMPESRMLSFQVDPPTLRSRLVLVTRSERLRLTEIYGLYTESLEWLGKVRTFLRQQGWIPQDERAGDANDGSRDSAVDSQAVHREL